MSTVQELPEYLKKVKELNATIMGPIEEPSKEKKEEPSAQEESEQPLEPFQQMDLDKKDDPLSKENSQEEVQQEPEQEEEGSQDKVLTALEVYQSEEVYEMRRKELLEHQALQPDPKFKDVNAQPKWVEFNLKVVALSYDILRSNAWPPLDRIPELKWCKYQIEYKPYFPGDNSSNRGQPIRDPLSFRYVGVMQLVHSKDPSKGLLLSNLRKKLSDPQWIYHSEVLQLTKLEIGPSTRNKDILEAIDKVFAKRKPYVVKLEGGEEARYLYNCQVPGTSTFEWPGPLDLESKKEANSALKKLQDNREPKVKQSKSAPKKKTPTMFKENLPVKESTVISTPITASVAELPSRGTKRKMSDLEFFRRMDLNNMSFEQMTRVPAVEENESLLEYLRENLGLKSMVEIRRGYPVKLSKKQKKQVETDTDQDSKKKEV